MGTTGPFERVAAIARLVSESDGFNQLIIFVIFIASVMVGVQTYESMEHNEVVNVIDAFVLGIFTLEVVIKVVSEGKKPWLYFVGKEWRWNNFDFAIVVLCMPMWGNTFRGGSVAILRLLRLMRVMKIVEKIPQLQIIVMGLIGGLKSVGYILLLLFLLFYLYAIAGITLFRNNDPFHYGDVLTALNSLFRMATMEDWTDIMYINIYGCLNHEWFDSGIYAGEGEGERCQNQASPFESSLFHVSFVVIAGLVMLSLFVGSVTMNMSHSLAQVKEQSAAAKEQRNLKSLKEKLTRAQRGYEACLARWKSRHRSRWKRAIRLTRVIVSKNKWKKPGTQAQKKDQSENHPAQNSRIADSNAELRDATLTKPNATSVMKTGTAQLHNLWQSFLRGVADYQEFVREKLLHTDIVAYTEMRKILLRIWFMSAANREDSPIDLDEEVALAKIIVEPEVDNRILQSYDIFAQRIRRIVDSAFFERFIMAVIIATGFVVGLQTNERLMMHAKGVLDGIDQGILVIFTLEVILRLIGEGLLPWLYFKSDWNKFDFTIVAVSYILPLLNKAQIDILPMLRLIRLLRVIKVLKSLPQLQVVVQGLVGGLASIGYIGVILVLFYYIFAILGMILFRENDPWHFGELQLAMLTLFRISTLDDWTDVMYINMYGCERYGYASMKPMCKESSPNVVISVLYYSTFIIFGSLVLLTLFIGIVTTSMEDATSKLETELELDRNTASIQVKFGLSDQELREHIAAFYLIDRNKSGLWCLDEVSLALYCCGITNVSKGMVARWMIQLDENADGELSFEEVVELSSKWKRMAEEIEPTSPNPASHTKHNIRFVRMIKLLKSIVPLLRQKGRAEVLPDLREQSVNGQKGKVSPQNTSINGRITSKGPPLSLLAKEEQKAQENDTGLD